MKVVSKLKRTRSVMLSAALIVATSGALWMPAQAQTQAPLVQGLPDFTQLVSQTADTVVNIRATERVAANSGAPQMDEEMQEFFRRFFGVPIPSQPRRGSPQPQQEERPTGVGSGFILTSDGYIMTNAHVVDGADELLVTLPDKREFKAKLIGADARTDVAVVKIETTGLPAVKIGDVGQLKVGEWVIAIGSPFGLENTVTAGIVSAKQRDTGDYLPFIQTDVAINPGNSGGPLINMRGEVVGINSQIYSRSGGFMGISFSIPIDEAIRVSDQLRATGKVTRGRIGVSIDQVSKDVAESLGLGRPRGALVRSLEAGSPAEKAGLEPGDIIVKFDGTDIERPSDLPRLVGNTPPGKKATVTVLRRGQTRDLGITVAEIEPEQTAAAGSRRPTNPPTQAVQSLGLNLRDLTAAEKTELKVKGGVLVEAAQGQGARAGIRQGDVILTLGNQQVADVKSFEALYAKADKNKPVNVLLRRGEWAQYVVIRPAGR
ncbi:MAG: putative serine protease HtrA [Paracidovorax wautersii]|uniref:Probable periplasmic serine endoprotease DegP-like n=1 Tax=Paracidovorax wautersii TaxID=1177982 RepID=A0A7V8JP66_9BURK|nr:MAG: putative serine protease HtrA [Paracidovorax wautersii]